MHNTDKELLPRVCKEHLQPIRKRFPTYISQDSTREAETVRYIKIYCKGWRT